MVNELVQLLSDLVKIPSVCGDEAEISDFIAKWFKDHGLPVEILPVSSNRSDVITRLIGPQAGPRILLNGHMDTVDPGNGWTRDPFGAEVEDGRMYGRGAFDMKAGLACILWVAVVCKAKGLPRKGELIVTAVVDEEAIARGTYALVEKDITKGVDLAMIPEPTNLNVVTTHCGRAVFEIEVRGKAAHSELPEHGVNAIEETAIFVNALRGLRGPNHPKMGSSRISALRIEGGQEEVMLVPDRCRLVVDQCLVPGHTTASALEDLKRLIAGIGVDASVKVPARETPFCEPFEIPDDNPQVRLVAETAGNILGKTPDLDFHRGPCDSCILFNQGRIPTIEFGPSGSGLHQPDEYVQLESVNETAAVYQQIVSSLLS